MVRPAVIRNSLHILAAAALSLVLALVVAAPAGAVTQKQAASKALAALKSKSGTKPVIVFGLPKSLRTGTKITQAGTTEPTRGSTKGVPSKLRGAGVRTVAQPTVARLTGERFFFFYEDSGPFQLYQHSGRVALVGATTGKVVVSRTIMWPPLVNRRLPAFLRTASAYRSSKYQVFYRPWAIDAGVQQPRTAQRNQFDNDPFGPGRPLPSQTNAKAIADRLAAEHSCVLRVTDTLPSFWNVSELNLTRSYVGTLFEALERANPDFVDERYGARTGESLGATVDRLVKLGCKDILLYIAGQGFDSNGDPVIDLGNQISGSVIRQQLLSASDLRTLISGRPGVTFKLKIDAPFAGGMIDRLRDLENVLLVETAAAPGEAAFAFIPEVSQDGRMVTDASNPAGLLAFTGCELIGLKAFYDSSEEIDKAHQGQNEGVSFLAEMLARSQELCKGSGFADDLGAQPQLYAPLRASGNGTNKPPKADKQDVVAQEDTPRQITLTGSDDDGDPITFQVTKQPDHGTLSGSGATRTYTPSSNYAGPDNFEFKVEDSKGASSNTAKVSITVEPNDPPSIDTTDDPLFYTQGDGPQPIDPNLLVTDPESANLSGATVRISAGHVQADDELSFADQNGITGAYNDSTGTLTLTGTTTVANYETALRSVKYENVNMNPSGSRTIEFKATDDQGAASAPAMRAINLINANDAPVVTTSAGATPYTENNPATPIDGALTVTDTDDTDLEQANVRISAGFESGDDLVFADQSGITGVYNSGTGELELTGTASVSDYETALRSIRFRSTDDDPTASVKTVEFVVNDGDDSSPPATKNITITPVNDAPALDTTDTPRSYTEGDGQQPVDDLIAVTDPDSQLQGATVQITSNFSSAEDDLALPAQGGLTINYNDSTGTLTIAGTASVATYQAALRDVRYVNTSDNPSSATRTVSFQVTDSSSAASNVATRDVTVTPVNDAPVANDDAATVGEDAAATSVPVLGNDTDAEGDAITISSASDPANGTVVLTGGSPGAHTGLTYQPDPNYCNNPPSPPADTFTYTVNGGDTATVSMTVTCAPDNPTANDDTRTVNEDSGATSFTVLSNDTDPDTGDAIDITNVSDPANGTATIVDGSPDTISYTPDANYCNDPPGTSPDTFTYTVNGGDTAQVSVTVTCVNDAPVANDDTATVTEDSSNNNITVITNDTDVESDAIEITNVADPANGTATITQGSPDSISYTPDANYCNNPPGTTLETFTYTVNGGDTATVTVTVSCDDDDPVANDDTATVTEDSSGSGNDLNVTGNDTDVESDQIEITNVSDPANGTATIVQGNPDKVNYTPDANYCNDPPGTSPDTFTYTVNGGDTATVSVTVTCIDDAHVANDDTATVNEDSSNNNINVVANDTDVENDQVEITNVADPANGSATITQGNPDSISYTPDANYCNNPPGTTLETFTYTVAGGDTATVTVTVSCDDDNPVAVDDNPTAFNEDSGANTIDVLANDTDVDGGTKTIQSKTDGTNGTVAITNAGADLTYTPNANFCGSDSFTYTLNGGDSATVNVSVTCLNDAPVVDLNGEANPGINTTATFAEVLTPGSGDVTLAPNADTSDVDDTNLESATVTLTNEQDAGMESLSVNQMLATSKGITVTIAVDGDTITLTGQASKQDYEDVLRTVSYDNTAAPPDPSPDRVVEFKVNDGDVDSTVATATVTVVPLNIPPVVDLSGGDEIGFDETATFTENGSAVNITDSDADLTDADDANLVSMTVTLTNHPDDAAESLTADVTGTTVVNNGYNSGTGVLTLSGTAPLTEYETVLRTVKYNNTSDTPNTASRSVTFKVNDGQADSNTATSSVSVAAVNDKPVNTVPGGQTLAEDGSKTFSSGNSNQISVADVDAGTNPLKVTLSVTNGTLTLNGTTGLTFTPPADGTSDQTMTFTGSQADINAALNGLIYTPNSNYNGADTLSITTDDQGNTGSGGAQTDTDNVGLTITAVNDAPTNTVPGAQSVDEDVELTLSAGNGNQVSTADPDSGASDVRATVSVSNGVLTLATLSGLNFACVGCSGDGLSDTTMTFDGTVAEVNAALNGLKYLGNSNYNGPDTLTLTVNDQGNTGSGGALQDQDTVAITVNPVNDAPSADNETFGGAGNLNDQAHGNTTMQVDDPSDDKSAPTNPHTEITGDILDGDSDVDGPGPLIVQSAGSDAGATNGQTADGGTVTIEQDGDFVYQPPASTSCDNGTDSFNYKISDQASSGAGPIPGTAIGTVTIHLEGCVWYVNNNAAGNAGTSTQPFDTLAQAETASGANHTVFVFDGDNTSTGYQTGYAMNSGERLIGEHEGLVVDPDQGGSMSADTLHPANPGAHPTLAGTNEDVVDLDDGNEVRGFNLDPAGTGSGIAGASGDTGGGTIDDINIVDTSVAGSQPGLELDATTGTFNISNLVVNNSAAASPPNTATGVRLNNAGTVNFNPTGQTSITTTGAKGLDAISTNMGSGSTFDDITVSGSNVGGVNLSSASGTTTLGDGTGTDLSLTTTSGVSPAFGVANSGTVSVDSAGSDDVHAIGGPAVDVTGTSGPTLSFDDVDSINSANDGINLDGLGTGTFSASSGDIGGADGISFDLNGGSGAITYPGIFGNHDGTTAIDITGRSGGVVSLSGSINDTNDAGGGVNVSSNTGGSTVLSGATKQFNTGASDAVSFTSSDGHTFVLSGGGTDIDVTSGNGLNADTSGTVEVSGATNTLDKTSAGSRGLNISNTDIAAADVTFQRIRTDGALTGIRLNNTGTAGNLAVTGTGGTCTNADTSGCSGGEIENGTGADSSSATPDGTGIVLNDTDGVSLTRMWLHDHSNYGIRGTDVNGFTLANSVINGVNGTNSAGGFDDSSVYFDNNSGPALTGSASVTSSHVQGGFTNNFWVSQTSGSLNRLTIDGSTFGHNSTTNGNQSLMVEGLGSSTTNVTLQNSTLTGSRAMVSQFIGNGSGGGDLDVYNNTFTNTHPAADSASGMLGINGGAAGTFNVDVSTGGIGDNTFQGSQGHAVNIIHSNGSGTLTGQFTGNSIGVDSAGDNSGSLNGSGVRFQHAGGGGTASMNITNNTIREYNNDGITLQASAGGVADTGIMNINVTGNTVTDPGSNPLAIGFNGIRLTAGVIAGDDFDVCAHIKSNSVVGSNTDPVDNPGQPDIFTWARMNSTINLPGYAGGATDSTAVANFVKNQNDANPNSPATEAPAPTTGALASNSGTFTGTGTGCP